MTELEKRIGYTFQQPKLLQEALAHPSLNKKTSNQRLEFLGDAVLGAVVARLLYELYPQESEGDLARRQAALVRSETLARVAEEMALGEALRMAQSEESAGGRQNPANLEDACEALIGALFMDGGYAAAESFIVPRWKVLANKMHAPPKDAKTALQEWSQARGLPVPNYRVVETSGPAHAPLFIIEVSLPGHSPLTASASTKRAAEQAAAKALLQAVGGVG